MIGANRWRVLVCIALVSALFGCEHLPSPVPPQESGETPQSSISENLPPQETPVVVPEASAAPQPQIGFFEPGTGQFVRQPQRPVATSPKPGQYTLNFENTDLNEVIKVILGDLLGSSYSVEPGVQGTVTLQTSAPVARDALIPILESLLRMNGAMLLDVDGLLTIATSNTGIQGRVTPQIGDSGAGLPRGQQVRIVPLQHISASEMAKMLEPLASPNSIVRIDTPRNLLVLSGHTTELNVLLQTIEIFDVNWLQGMSLALFVPDYVDAPSLASEIEQVTKDTPLAGQLRVVVIERLNGVFVMTTSSALLRQVKGLVDKLDQDTGGVGKRLFVYHVQNGKATDLAAVLTEVFSSSAGGGLPPARLAPGEEPISLMSRVTDYAGSDLEAPSAVVVAERPQEVPEQPASQTGSGDIGTIDESTDVRIIADEVNNSLLVMATSRDYQLIRDALRELDILPLQVLIEMTIAEITLDGRLEYGLEWFFKNSVGDRQGSGLLDLGAVGLAPLVPGFSYTIADAGGAVRAVLNALAQDSKLNIVSSPSLMVLNNQTANIEVGDQVPITTQQQQATVADSTVVNTIEYRDTGVLLTVKPRVNAGGLVVMEVDQEVSDVADTGANTLTPIIQQRKIASTVAVQSGETVVLGGLIRENRLGAKQGIPVLYNLPLIGPLFGSTVQDAKRTELVVLITPTAVYNMDTASHITRELQRKMRSLEPLSGWYQQ